ncbi:MAG: TIGR04283 family arsenosugar biosynthesis glycosyltransferase [Phycisphaerae bacterium]|nr:TIGR04283 family arsenosugar biosynthesis glycosyltransferase [Phycisphaerae bacterium]
MREGRAINVVIPALNEAASIGKVLAAIPDWVDEVIVVDNGSTDDTAAIAEQAGATVVREPRRGYGQACQTGMAAISWCDVLVFLDADFSDHPEEMDRLVGPIVRGEADLVIGSRTLGNPSGAGLTVPQRFGTSLACMLMNLIWRTHHTDLGPFRAVRWSALRSLHMRDRNYGWTIEMQIKAARAKLRVIEVPVRYRPRIGVSKISGTVRGVIGAGTKILVTIARYALLPAPSRVYSRGRLIVFTRYPLPGKAKTRLIPELGALRAAAFQRTMTERTIRTARDCAGSLRADIEIRYAGGHDRKVRRWLGNGLVVRPQGDGDLGRRMRRASLDAFDSDCSRVLIIGTDCPELSACDLRRAFEAIEEHDVVLGPSTDGGYWLIGLRSPAEVFEGVDWSTPRVVEQTLALASSAGLSVAILDEHTDIDTPEDFQDAIPDQDAFSSPEIPYLSVIIPARDEAEHIEAAIATAQADGIEIIVVDGHSSDQTAALAERAGARVLTCPPHRARQMNKGAAIARGKILLFLHADTRLPDDYTLPLFDALSDASVVGGAFGYKTDMSGPGVSLLERLVGFRSRVLCLPYGDQALFVRRSIFESLGGFDDVSVAEDLRFVRRLRCRGRIMVLAEPAVTSGRRSRRLGLLRTTLVNQVIVAGCFLALPDPMLNSFYRRWEET